MPNGWGARPRRHDPGGAIRTPRANKVPSRLLVRGGRALLLCWLAAALVLTGAGPVPQAPVTDPRAVESARAGRYDEAIALTSQLLDRQPDHLQSRLIRALAYYYTAQPPQALADLDYALGRLGDDGNARTLRALVRLELGQYGEALADARQALSAPGLPVENVGAARLVVGRVLLAQGRRDAAAEQFEQVVALSDPTNARAARLGLELLAALPPVGGPAPAVQDLGNGFLRMEVQGRQIDFQVDNGVSQTAALSVARLLEARLAAVADATGVRYEGPLRLVVYRSEWDLEQQLGGQYRGPGLGRALRQGVRTSADGRWMQHVHVALTNLELLWNLTHEAVHIAQAQMGLDDAFPRALAWLVEGHAEYVTDLTLRDVAPASVQFRRNQRGRTVSQAVQKDRLLGLRNLERFRDWERVQANDAELAYGQAYYAAALFVERFGADAVFAMLRDQRGGVAGDAAFRAATRLTPPDFYAYVQERLAARADEDAASSPE